IKPWSSSNESALRRFVTEHPDGLIYYSPQYLSFLLAVLGPSCRCETRVAWRDGAPSGILPLMALQSPFGQVLNSLPFFGSNGGILAADAESEELLRCEYERLSRGPETVCATWISHPIRPQIAPGHDYQDERIAQWTVLPKDCDRGALLSIVEPSARRNLAKAEKAGITVQETAFELPFLEQVHSA